ncbi:MAG: hypothetical protein WCT37_03950 [Patescibacteria group bacterium]|jgi:hypothetical protein
MPICSLKDGKLEFNEKFLLGASLLAAAVVVAGVIFTIISVQTL